MADETKQANQIGVTLGSGRDVAPPSASAAEPQLPPTTTTFAAKAKDLEALRNAVVDAATVGAGLWLSYLFVLFYLAIAVGSVTHRDLLFEKPVRLPFLNVDLPLIGFFVLGPVLLLIVHTYVLLHFVLLAGKVGAFDAELRAQIDEDDLRARLRRQLPSNIFVQFLAGPREVREGVMGFLLRLIAQITLVAGPLALLVFFQLRFLPYHHEAIAWWQRVAVVADLALLWRLWPSVARGETTRLGWRDFRRGKVVAAGLASLAPILLVFTIATFPGEWLDASLPPVRLVPTKPPAWESDPRAMGWTSLHNLLVGGDVDFVARKPTSMWSNRLVLPGIDVIDHSKSDTEASNATLAVAFSLRGRRLEGAVLIDARLRKADFTAAQLQGAYLSRADLREAKFECAESKLKVSDQFPNWPSPRVDLQSCTQLQGASLDNAHLQGATLDHAQLQGATLDNADLQDTTLSDVQLQGTRLDGAHLQGATLSEMRLQGARLDGAHLQGAALDGAHLQGASLERAELQGASLDHAQLWGARLDDAHLQGAALDHAELQGASLAGARLQGASLAGAELQGASLAGARLQGASLSYIFAWRADVRRTELKEALVVAPETGPKYRGVDCRVRPERPACDWSAGSFAALKWLIEEQVPQGPAAPLERIAILDPAKPLDGEEEMAKAWKDLAGSSPTPDVRERSLAETLQQIGCDADGAPYVIPGLLRNLNQRFRGRSHPAAVAAAFLDEAHCLGARGLSEEDKVKLREIRDNPPPAPPGASPSTPKN